MGTMAMDVRETGTPVGRLARADQTEPIASLVGKGVEVVFDGTGVPSYILADMFGSLKKYTARRANRILSRRGAFWQDESYDHVIRDDNELERAISYVLNNPVNASLVQSWEQWPWTYVKPGLL